MNIKKNWIAMILTLMFIGTAVLTCGCGSSGVAEDTSGDKAEEISESSDDGSDDPAETKDEDEDKSKDKEAEKENRSVQKSEPSQLYFLTKDGYIEDIVGEYAVNMRDQEFVGDIGDVIGAYKDMDLDGDGSPDVIERYDDDFGYGYRIDFSAGGSIDTGVYSASPNEGEVIEFHDMDGDYTDEILITHYTESTAGPLCWQTYLYVKDCKDKWKGYPIIDDKLYCADLEDMIEDRTGIPYKDQSIRFAGIEMTDDGIAMLADFGKKEGPDQTFDYEGVLLVPDLEKIKEGKASKKDAFKYAGSSKDNAVKCWPMDAAAASDSEDTAENGGESSAADNTGDETIPEYLLYVKSSDGYANLRTGPGTEYDIICQLQNGEELEVYRGNATSTDGKTWLKVAYFDGDDSDGDYWTTGWIAESQVE